MGGWFWVVLRLQPLSREWDVWLPAWIAAPGVGLGLAGALGIMVVHRAIRRARPRHAGDL